MNEHFRKYFEVTFDVTNISLPKIDRLEKEDDDFNEFEEVQDPNLNMEDLNFESNLTL